MEKRQGSTYVSKSYINKNIIYKKTVLAFFEINEKKSFFFTPLPRPFALF